MSDRFPAQIWIGGQVPDKNISGLIEALVADDASHEYGDVGISKDCTRTELLELYLNEGILHFKDDEAPIGEFLHTETFCMEHGIAWDRNSDHYCEYDAENVYWRPGKNSSLVFRYANSNGHEIIAAAPVREALALLNDAEGPSTRNPVSQALIERAIVLLNETCPELPPKLENFEIIS